MSCSVFCVKCLHYMLNCFYGLMALVMLGAGMWMAFEPAMKSMMAEVKFPVAYVLIGIGIVMVITATLADIAVCKVSRCLLVLSFVGYVVTFVLFIAAIIWIAVSRDTLKSSVDQVLNNCVKQYATSQNKVTSCIVILDVVQPLWKCCGRNSYLDYTIDGLSSGQKPVMPASCATSSDNALSFLADKVRPGCSGEIQKSIDKYFPVILAVSGAELVIPLGLAILSLTLYCLSKKGDFIPVRT